MNASDEKLHFEFRVDTWDVESYSKRRLLLEELESVPKTSVSAICERAGWGGFESHVVTIISVIANILTIAHILHKHLTKTEKPKENTLQNVLKVYVFIGDEEVILNNMSRDEIVTLLKSRRHT